MRGLGFGWGFRPLTRTTVKKYDPVLKIYGTAFTIYGKSPTLFQTTLPNDTIFSQVWTIFGKTVSLFFN